MRTNANGNVGTNGGRVGDRRHSRLGSASSPRTVMAGQLDATQQQLWQARERLKGARRRVVQLEEVLGSWELIARDLDDALAGVDAVASVRSPARTAVAL